MKPKYVAIFSALLASACCIGPLLLVAMGVGIGAVFISRYPWFFVIGALAVLTWAWAKYLREKTTCNCKHKPIEARRSGMFTLLIATVMVLGFVGLNLSRYAFASPPALARTQAPVGDGLNRVVIPVEGLSCVTCEIPVRNSLKRIDGVKSVHVSVASKNAMVDYEPAKTSPKQLVAAINSTGYRASLPNK